MRTLIRGATCIFSDGPRMASVLIEDAVIRGIDPPASARVDERIDADGLHLLPGVIDDQVHFREPGLEHKEDLRTGSLACAKGGVTTFLEMPNTRPPAVSQAAIDDKLRRAAGRSAVNYGFYIGASFDPVTRRSNVPELKTAIRTPGIKIFIGSSTGDLLVDDQEALEEIFGETTLPICAHCEDEQTVRANAARLSGSRDVADHSRIRDHQAAIVATRRAVDLALRHRHPFHVLHVSTRAEAEFLRTRPAWVTAEACPHHLWFTVDDYPRLGTLVQMNPSIKTAADVTALWQGLAEGTIEVIATDHAPHTLEEKRQPYPQAPSGLPAVENSLALMLDAASRGLCTLNQVVSWMCEAPARIWNLNNKGRLAEGFDADLVLVDLRRRHLIDHSRQITKSRWSPWHGVQLMGLPVRTIVRGRTVYADGRLDESVRGAEVTFNQAPPPV